LGFGNLATPQMPAPCADRGSAGWDITALKMGDVAMKRVFVSSTSVDLELVIGEACMR